ncbi:MAG: serine/threonine protein kinase [Gemmatimonadales bacterium]|nr:serine/threonine protein kinase [Gemmatimonadales bacterium]
MALTASDWSRVQDLFHTLADRSAPEQFEDLQRLSTDEPEIAEEVRGMLEADAAGATLLDRGMAGAAGDVLHPGDTLPPHQFGPYRIVRLLGEGGMGVVYLGHRDDVDANAAIKILANAWLSPARRDRFRTERQTLAALDHPSIARLLDADHLPDGTPWFAMEYVEGEALTSWVWKRRLGVRPLLELFLEVCDAVQHAHERAVIHRDIKPSNVLVTKDGGIKLLDFGIAKRFPALSASDTRSHTTSRLLTPQYAAPEQFQGRVGVTADVYALGVVLFELIAGALPYRLDGDTTGGLVATIRAAYPPNIRRTLQGRRAGGAGAATSSIGAGDLSGSEWADLDALLATALAPDQADRYRSVEAFRADIARFLAHQPLAARKATWGYRAGKFVRRRWREVSLAAAVVVTAGAGLFLHTRSLTAARDVAIVEAARTTRLRQFLVDMFQGGEQGSVPGDSLRLGTVVRNGIREARGLTNDPLAQTELLLTLGIISEQLGSFERADTLFRQSVEYATALHGPDHPETLRARIRSAVLLNSQGKIDTAEKEFLAIEAVAVQRVPADHPVVAELNQVLGKLLAERGKIPEAIARLERAVAQRSRADTVSREYSDALRELGNAAYYSGNVRRADSLFRRALPVNRLLFGPNHPNVGYLLTNLGILASVTGDLETAERDLKEAVAISAGWFGEHHWLTAGARVPLGQTLVRKKQFAEAVPVLETAILDMSREPQVPLSSINLARNALGHAQVGIGDREAARATFTRAARELRQILGAKHMNTMLSEASLATVLTDTGKLDTAIVMLRDLVARGSAAYGDAHHEVATFRIRLGHALLLAHRPRETIELTAAGLRVLDSLNPTQTDVHRTARSDLEAAYTAIGDTVSAAKYRRPQP